jgi:hypothetical protein
LAEGRFRSARAGFQSAVASQDFSIFSNELGEQIDRAEKSFLAGAETKRLKANYLVALARELPDYRARLEVYCRSFDIADDLRRLEPFNAKVLLNWLHWQQMLSSTECARDLEQPEQLIKRAVELDPVNTEVIYQAALLLLWSDNRQLALPYFKRVIELSNRLSAGEEGEILGAILSAEDIKAAIPGQFPQVLRWSELLKKERPLIYRLAEDEIRSLQLEAFNKSVLDYSSGLYPARVKLSHLMGLLQVAVDDTVRKSVDELISQMLGERSALGSYLKQRAELSLIKVNSSRLETDSLPFRSSFSLWNNPGSFILDRAHNSLGFYNNLEKPISFIELGSERAANQIAISDLQLLVSDDNQSWKELPFKMRQIANPNLAGSWLVLEPESSAFKYFKVNYKSGERVNSFRNRGDLMLRVYGP